ncbi:hypothetical protein ACOZ38_34245 [Sphaerisporangium viridialbum]|uniref:WXG100-like domain-containing protein n=1 Tax=Sphaerisporangium viridialbum TaxID=46189 RepID=UPI003C752634
MLGRWALYPAGTSGIAAFVAAMILSDWPEGDPDGAREAGKVWRKLAARIDANTTDTDAIAKKVWQEHPSQGSEAFRRYWSVGGFGSPPGGVVAYPPQVSAYCRRVAEACEEYAEAVETARRALKVAALTSYAQLMLAASWPWVGAQGAALSKWLVDRLYKKVQAQVLLKLLENATMKIVITKLTGYAVGSGIFALGDEALALGARAYYGEDLGSFSDNASATFKDFAACMVFFGLWDATKLGRLGKVFPENDLGDSASFLFGSTAYTVTLNLEDGKTGWDVMPTMQQMLTKSLIGLAQRGRDPEYPRLPTTQP